MCLPSSAAPPAQSAAHHFLAVYFQGAVKMPILPRLRVQDAAFCWHPCICNAVLKGTELGTTHWDDLENLLSTEELEGVRDGATEL